MTDGSAIKKNEVPTLAVDNSQKHYAKWKKPITKDYITQYDSIHKNLQNLQIKKQEPPGPGVGTGSDCQWE